jgi:hypothetical protein
VGPRVVQDHPDQLPEQVVPVSNRLKVEKKFLKNWEKS